MTRAKTPTIALVQPSESLLVSLAIVLAHFGRWVPLSELRRFMHSFPAGDPLEALAANAGELDLAGERIDATADSLQRLELPAILRWGSGHFVVLEGRDGTGWWINDPRGGTRRVSDEEFARVLPSGALVLRPTGAFRPGGEPPSLRRSLAHLLRGTRSAFVACSVASIGLTLGNFAVAGMLSYFMDAILVDRIPDRIPPFLVGIAVISLVRSVCTYLQAQYSLRIERAAVLRLEAEVLERVVSLPQWETDVRAPGDIQQRLAMIRNFSTSMIGPLALAPANLVTLILFGMAIAFISPLVALGVLAAIAFGSTVVKVASPRIFALNAAQQRAVARQRATLLSGLGARSWLAESGAYRLLVAQWMGELASARSLAQDNGRLQLIANTARNSGRQVVTQVGTLVLGGMGVIAGSVTIGELAALQSLVQYFQTSVAALQQLFQSVPVMRSNLARVEDLLEIPADRSTIEEHEDVEVDGGVLRMNEVALGGGRTLSGELRAGTVSYVEGITDAELEILEGRLRGRTCGSGRVVLRRPVGAKGKEFERPGVLLLGGEVGIHPGTIEENVAGFDPRIRARRVWEALDAVGMGNRVRAAGPGLAQDVGEARVFDTRAEQVRFELAAALVRPPVVAVMHGVLQMVPPALASHVLDRLLAQGTAVLVLEADWTPPEDAFGLRVGRGEEAG